MKIFVQIRFYCFIAIVLAIIFMSSCANQGSGPTGGPKDSIPPVILHISPLPNDVNVSAEQITIEFDEYIQTGSLAQDLVISPPLAKDPTVRNKGKSLVIKLNEDLIPDRTYSFDFRNGIKDFNEGNPIENFRMRFATGDVLDTMVIAGKIIDAETMLPVENVMVSAYTILNDTVISTIKPDFIANSDIDGHFIFDNLPHAKYKVYALIDGDRDMLYSQTSEKVAFLDSAVEVSANYIHQIDTMIVDSDTTISNGYTEFFPGNLNLLLFEAESFNQYLTSYSRTDNHKIELLFNESLTDSFRLELLNDTITDWNYTEFGIKRDSVDIWITDSTVINIDTLYLAFHYSLLNDSTNTYYTFSDTIKFLAPQEKVKKEKKQQKEAKVSVPTFNFKSKIANNYNYSQPIVFESEYPLFNFQDSIVHLYEVVDDSILTPIKFKLHFKKNSLRKFTIRANLKPQQKYSVKIDSAAVYSITGIPNNTYDQNFITQKEDYYGSIIMNISGIENNSIIYLLKNNKNEDIVDQKKLTTSTNEVKFKFLEPGKYILKIVDDRNKNGEWDTGNLEEKIQPERIYYFEKIIGVKSNWDDKENWQINMNEIQVKNVIDPDAEEKDPKDPKGKGGKPGAPR